MAEKELFWLFSARKRHKNTIGTSPKTGLVPKTVEKNEEEKVRKTE